MNIHPLFVHFPIGILTLYVLFEIVRIHMLTKQPFYFEFKAILVITGAIAMFLASITGDIAEQLVEAGGNPIVAKSLLPLVETHATAAAVLVGIFSVLAGSYLFECFKRRNIFIKITQISFLEKISTYIQKIALPLACIGALSIFVTGALGASLVYGPDLDPMVHLIYTIFGA